MKNPLKKFFVLLAAVFAINAAKSATVFPIATNLTTVNFGNEIAFDGTNYMAGFVSGANQNLDGQLISATNGALIGSQLIAGTNTGFPPATALAFGKTNYLAAWSDNSISSSVDVSGQFISRSGAKVGSAFKLLSSAGSYGLQSVEAMASDGTNFLVVWQDQNNSYFYGQLVTPSGSLSGSAFTISTQSGNGNGFDSAAVAFGKTNYLVVWQSQNGGSTQQTYGEFVSLNGHQGTPFQINQTDSSDQNPLAVAFDGTNYLAVWNWDSPNQIYTTDWEIFGRLVSQTGAFPGNELHLVTDAGSQSLPTLAFDGANYLMAWSDSPDGLFADSDSIISFQFFNRSGSASGDEFTVFTAQGTNSPLLGGLLFDGTRFAAVATLGTVSRDGNGDVTGFPSSEVFGAFIPSSTALQVTTASLPDGTTTVPYSQTLAASGGQAPYTWTLASNSLPAGLSLSSGGVISGTPTTAVTTNFVVQAKDNTNSTATQLLSLTINTLDTSVVFTVTPATVSNTYNGPITIQVTGLNSNETVTVQKYLDANTNGVVDATDLLIQQFDLTDGSAGMVIGGVTNINVPGDTDGGVNGQITAQLHPSFNFMQTYVGKYIFVLSSPSVHFSPQTASFSVTNFPYAQRITGTVVSNTTPVPNAVIILFSAPRGGDHGPGNPVGGTVANNSGVYNIQVPPGTYVPMAFKSNYVGNFSTSPLLTVSSGTITTNLALTGATATISGKVVDADNNSLGLPGLAVPMTSDSGLIAVGFSDTNGNFNVPVTSGSWSIDGSAAGSFDVLGYVGYNNSYNVSAGQAGVTLPVHKANALFYGTVKDNLGNPLPGIDLGANDNNNSEYQSDGFTDTNGNYVIGALGGLGSGDPWQVQVSSDSSPANYLFSQPPWDNGSEGTNLNAETAAQVNFTAILTTNHITGNVQFDGTNVVGVQVDAYATIGTNSYQSQMDTDANGNYSLNVANGNWSVNIYDCGCSDSDSLNNILDGGVEQGNYQTPASRKVNINNNNQTANFTIQPCNGVQILTSSPLPDGQQGSYYDTQLQGSDCNNNFIWSLDDPSDFPSNLTFNSDGEIFGTPDTSETYNFSVNVSDGNGHSADTNMSLTISPPPSPLEITTTDLPNATNTTFYSQTLQASGGQPPYSWSIADYSALPSNLTLATNGVLSGTLSDTADTYYFDVIVTDAASNTQELDALPLTVVNPPLPPLVITNTSLPNGNVGALYSAQLGATGGQSPYFWSYALGSQNLSAIGLSLNSTNGLISGTPTTNRVFSFKVQVTDSNVSDSPTNKVLSITINPKPVLASQSWQTNRFQMRLTGAANQNYTLQLSTNLGSTNWIPLFITNNTTTNSFLLTDPNATNKQRFYRVLIGP